MRPETGDSRQGHSGPFKALLTLETPWQARLGYSSRALLLKLMFHPIRVVCLYKGCTNSNVLLYQAD